MPPSTKKALRSKALTKGKRPKMVVDKKVKALKSANSPNPNPTKGKKAGGGKKKMSTSDGDVTVVGDVSGKAAAGSSRGKIYPIKRKARVERLLKKREPQLVEHTKRVLILKGNHSSQIVNDTMKDFGLLTKPNNKVFSRKNDILPFEDINSLEFLCEKNQCALFCLGTHSKKRPDNIIMGRTFDGHLLDMYEFGIKDYQGIHDFTGTKKRIGSKPVMVFLGDQWESDSQYQRISNLLLDFFRADKCEKISLKGMDHTIS